jgi:hypothetical protein
MPGVPMHGSLFEISKPSALNKETRQPGSLNLNDCCRKYTRNMMLRLVSGSSQGVPSSLRIVRFNQRL